ncbi:MAG: helix-turn-helix domain-containing protein [Candidatus Bathyarchaeia archaeon]
MSQLRPPCEEIVQQLLPAFRCLVAKELIEKHRLSQIEAARRLGTTQATISHYLASKRGFKDSERLRSIPGMMEAAVKVAKELAEEKSSRTEFTPNFCRVCAALRGIKNLCKA